MSRLPICSALALTALASPPTAAAQSCATQQASLTSTGAQPGTNSQSAALAPDGGTVAWSTGATNVTPGDLNGFEDVFTTTLASGAVELASLAWNGSQANGDSRWPSLSSDGDLVVFWSSATNLVPGAPAQHPGVYARSRASGATERIDVTPAGAEGDGTDSNGGVTAGAGRYVAFWSESSNLAGLDTNGQEDAFLRDRSTGETQLVSVAVTGASGNDASYASALTPDGRWVVFNSYATDLVAGDTNLQRDVFLREPELGVTVLVSQSSSGEASNGQSLGGSISADGRWVAFQSRADNLAPGMTLGRYQVYVRDLATGTTSLVSSDPLGAEGDADSTDASISANGRYVVFESVAANLVAGDGNGVADVFRRDLLLGTTEILNVTTAGAIPLAKSSAATFNVISADGSSVVFLSKAPTLTSPADPNGQTDVFVRSCIPASAETYCAAEANTKGCTPAMGSSGSPSATAGSGFLVTSANTVSQRMGLFFYGTEGARLTPFQGGYRCVEPPVRRTPLRSSGGNATPDCSGLFALDFNVWIASGSDPALVAGQQVWGQWWSRDAGSSFNTNLSDAITFVIEP